MTPDAPSDVPSVESSQKGEARWKALPWLLSFLLAALIVALYANSLHGGWIYDDFVDVFGLDSVQRLFPLSEHFALGGHPRPLVNFSFALNHWIGKNETFVYHCTNVAIHIAGAWALFGLFRRLLSLRWRDREGGGWDATLLAFLIALLWGIHPLQTESVAYVTQRYESMASLFMLLCLYGAVRSHGARRPALWWGLAVLASLMAYASKEIAVSLPILVLLLDRACLAGSFRGAWSARRYLYLGLVLAWALFVFHQLHQPPKTFAGSGVQTPWWKYALNQPPVIFHYLRLAFWPHPLVLDYLWPYAKSIWELLPGLLGVGFLLAATLYGLIRNSIYGLLGACFFLILAPTSSFLPILDLAVEHRMYLPLAPVLAAVVLALHGGASRFGGRRPELRRPLRLSLLACAAAAIGILGCLTFFRSDDYRNSLSIWYDNVQKRPGNPRAHANYAHALDTEGATDEAIREVRIALSMAPYNPTMRGNLGCFLMTRKRFSEAIEELRLACRLDPAAHKSWVNLAKAYRKTGQFDQAQACVSRALALNPKFSRAHLELGYLRLAQRDLAGAREPFHRAMALSPGSSEARWGMAELLLEGGRVPEALVHFEAYVGLEPNEAFARTMVGQVLYATNHVPEAMDYWQRALRLDPRQQMALLSMAWGLSTHPDPGVRDGRRALALAEAAGALQKVATPPVLEAKAAALAELGRFPEAIRQLREAREILLRHHSEGAASLDSRLTCYEAGVPYLETPRKRD